MSVSPAGRLHCHWPSRRGIAPCFIGHFSHVRVRLKRRLTHCRSLLGHSTGASRPGGTIGLSVAQNGLSLNRSMPPTPLGPSRLLRSNGMADTNIHERGLWRGLAISRASPSTIIPAASSDGPGGCGSSKQSGLGRSRSKPIADSRAGRGWRLLPLCACHHVVLRFESQGLSQSMLSRSSSAN